MDKNIKPKIKIAQNDCTCCCIEPLYYSLENYNIIQFISSDNQLDFEAIKNYINPNDRFPVPSCGGRKGIIFVDDAVIYLQYHDQDGWIIVNVSLVTNFIN